MKLNRTAIRQEDNTLRLAGTVAGAENEDMGIILSEQKGNSGLVKADRGGKIPKTNDMGKAIGRNAQ